MQDGLWDHSSSFNEGGETATAANKVDDDEDVCGNAKTKNYLQDV